MKFSGNTFVRNRTRIRPGAGSVAATTARWMERPAAALAALFAAVDTYRVRRAAVRDLHGLNDRLLADIGLSRDDIPRVARDMAERRVDTGRLAEERANRGPKRVLAGQDRACCPQG